MKLQINYSIILYVYIFFLKLFSTAILFPEDTCSCAIFETQRMIYLLWCNYFLVNIEYMWLKISNFVRPIHVLCTNAVCYQVSIKGKGLMLTLLTLWEHNLFLYPHTAWYNTRNKGSTNGITKCLKIYIFNIFWCSIHYIYSKHVHVLVYIPVI